MGEFWAIFRVKSMALWDNKLIIMYRRVLSDLHNCEWEYFVNKKSDFSVNFYTFRYNADIMLDQKWEWEKPILSKSD